MDSTLDNGAEEVCPYSDCYINCFFSSHRWHISEEERVSFSPSRQSDSEEEVGGKNLYKKMEGKTKHHKICPVSLLMEVSLWMFARTETKIFSLPLLESKNAWGFRSALSTINWCMELSHFFVCCIFGNLLYRDGYFVWDSSVKFQWFRV